MEERITKQQLQKMYNVSRFTIEDWVKNQGLPMIKISEYKRYVRKSDLLKWEEKYFVS
jgi:transposase